MLILELSTYLNDTGTNSIDSNISLRQLVRRCLRHVDNTSNMNQRPSFDSLENGIRGLACAVCMRLLENACISDTQVAHNR